MGKVDTVFKFASGLLKKTPSYCIKNKPLNLSGLKYIPETKPSVFVKNTDYGCNIGNVDIFDEANNKLGTVMYNLSGDMLHFEGLESYVSGKGIGTRLIEELTKISERLGANGRLCATASPKPSVSGKLTNLEFYYKNGFRAVDKAKDAQIQKLIEEGKEIPIGLNFMTDIIKV